jgi:hypothetical protein
MYQHHHLFRLGPNDEEFLGRPVIEIMGLDIYHAFQAYKAK